MNQYGRDRLILFESLSSIKTPSWLEKGSVRIRFFLGPDHSSTRTEVDRSTTGPTHVDPSLPGDEGFCRFDQLVPRKGWEEDPDSLLVSVSRGGRKGRAFRGQNLREVGPGDSKTGNGPWKTRLTRLAEQKGPPSKWKERLERDLVGRRMRSRGVTWVGTGNFGRVYQGWLRIVVFYPLFVVKYERLPSCVTIVILPGRFFWVCLSLNLDYFRDRDW